MALGVVTLGLGVVFLRPGYPLLALLLALSFSAFVLRTYSPGLVLVPVLIVELTLASYFNPSFGMSHRYPVIVGATILASSLILNGGILQDRIARRVLIPAIGFIVIATMMNAMFSEDPYLFKYLRYQFVQLLALMLAAFVIRYRYELVIVSLAALGIGVAGAMYSLWQHFSPLTAPLDAGTFQSIRGYDGRALGFASSPVLMSSQMIFLIPPLLGVLLCWPSRIDRTRIGLAVAFLLLAAGLNFSYTRSAVFGMVPAIVVMGLYLRGRLRLMIVGGALAGVVAFQLAAGTGLLGDRYYEDQSTGDESASTHYALWDVGLAVAVDHALSGVGHEHFEAVSLDYVGEVEDDEASGAGSIGDERPHNDFLSVWISWGIFALIAYVGIFLGTLRNCHLAAKSDDPLVRGLALGCIGGVVAYAVHSLYHNSMDSTMFLWLYAGASIALARFALQSRRMGHGQPTSWMTSSPVWRN